MKLTRFLFGFALLALTAGGNVMANEIYKWTDADGNVHYEDRPTGSATEERMAFSYRRSNSASVQQRVQKRMDSQASRAEAKAAAAEEQKSADDAAAESAATQKKCESHRAQLQTMVQSRRLYREGADGEREYLDDKQIQQARQKVEEFISKNCSS